VVQYGVWLATVAVTVVVTLAPQIQAAETCAHK
jgi:hypothetical protein